MRLLIIGNALSPYTIYFAKYLKGYDAGITLDIIHTNTMNNSVFPEEFHDLFYTVFRYKTQRGILSKIPKVRAVVFWLQKKLLIRRVNRKLKNYDVICLHALTPINIQVFRFLRPGLQLVVGAIWGSDFYKRGGYESDVFNMMDSCDRIIVPNPKMQEDIISAHSVAESKFRHCIFGAQPLEELNKLIAVDPIVAKKRLFQCANYFVITCGYNGHSNQQHLDIINSFGAIKSQLPQNLLLVFPMTYGGESSYKERVKHQLESLGLNYTILENYLSEEDNASLRISTDLFIQVQKTDALSGSMREHLYAQNLVLTGAWLPYETLKNDGVYFEEINDMSSLSEKIAYILSNFSTLKVRVKTCNTINKFEKFRWPICIKDWYKVFNEYKEKFQ